MSTDSARVRMQPPARLHLFVWSVTAAAEAALLVSLRVGSTPDTRQVLVAMILAAMVGVAHAFPIPLAPRVRVSADTAPAFAAALLLPPYLAILVSVVGVAGGEAVRRPALIQTAYNVAVASLRTAAAAAVVSALMPATLVAQPDSWRAALAFVAATLTMYVVNIALIDAVVAVQRRLNPLAGWWARHRGQMLHEGSLYLLGVLVAVIGARWPVALLLLAVPSAVVYRSLRDGVAVRMQTRHALQELADVIDLREDYAAGHSRRTADLARALALKLNMPADEAELVFHAARVHNVGQLGIKSSILSKTGALTAAEWATIRTHPEAGARILSRFPEYVAGGDLVLAHHERWDGRGYPRGLRGDAIPLGARVIAAADAFVAMTSRRPYRPALLPAVIRLELLNGRGAQFDPRVVDALFELLDGRPEFNPQRADLPSEGAGQPA